MMSKILLLSLSIALPLCTVLGGPGGAGGSERAGPPDGVSRTIIYDGVATVVGSSPMQVKDPADLWITTADLARATKFKIKPQGVCRNELCFPIPKERKERLVAKQGRTTYFNLGEFARMVHQPGAVDSKNSIWLFGPRQSAQNEFIQSLEAPNFTLPDLNGKMHSLSDFRGKKVLLITWASW